MSIEHFENWEDSVQVKVILYVCVSQLSRTTMLLFSKVSANFQSNNTIMNIADLLELTIQTKKPFPVQIPIKKLIKNCCIFKNYEQSRYR